MGLRSGGSGALPTTETTVPELSPICIRLVVSPAASTLGIWRRRCSSESQNCRSSGGRFQRVPLIVVWKVYVRSAAVLWPCGEAAKTGEQQRRAENQDQSDRRHPGDQHLANPHAARIGCAAAVRGVRQAQRGHQAEEQAGRPWIVPGPPGARADPTRLPRAAECRALRRPGARWKGSPPPAPLPTRRRAMPATDSRSEAGGPGEPVPRPARRVWRTRVPARCREPAAGWRHWRRQSAGTVRPRRSAPPARGAHGRSRFPSAAALAR